MPFDGSTVYAVCRELRQQLLGGRIDKIYQPESDEIILAVRSLGKPHRLLLDAGAGHARLQLTDRKPETPLTPPMFCMLFRKYFGGAKLTDIRQKNFDRIVELHFDTYNELGDPCRRRVCLEIMGKHSNLILIDEDGRIIDAVHHVTPLMSSVRAVMPGLPYELPSHNQKKNPLEPETAIGLREALSAYPGPIAKALYLAYNGLCPFASREILHLADLEEKITSAEMTEADYDRLFEGLQTFMLRLTEAEPVYILYLRDSQPLDYSVFPYENLTGAPCKHFDTLSALLDVFYGQVDVRDKLRQKSQDLTHLISTNLDRARRKEAIQLQQLQDTADREKDRLYGELITANLHRLRQGMTMAQAVNYYEEEAPTVEIPLDAALTPPQNAQRYYNRYNKKKRTEQALTEQLVATRDEIRYLESLEDALRLADCEKDLEDLRLEMHQTGYIRRARRIAKNLSSSKPLTFTTSEGLPVLVGKNNTQNDTLTFRTADPYDLWFHAKDIPGSHVILSVAGREKGVDYTDRSLEEAARLAAGHSKAASGSKVPVDYTLRRYVKKPAGSKPGFVIYTHQTTVFVEPTTTIE